MNKLAHTAAVLSLTVALGVEAAALSGRQAPAAGAMNNTDNPLSINSYLSEGYTNGSVAPGTWAGDAAGQYVVVNPSAVGVDDNSQVPWCDATIFIGDADVQGNFQTGWQALPSLVNFDLKRDLVVDKAENAVLPYYVERAKDYSKVKRAIIVQPGQPRDSWKYTNLIRNALVCAAANATMGVQLRDVLVVGPAWLSSDDKRAGAAEANDLYFPSGGSWSEGVLADGPGRTKTSSFKAMDDLVTKFFDKSTFPQLGSVIVAGHSLGGSFTQRYAMLRKYNASEDPYIQYWTGNCGAYTWPSQTHPVTAAQQCSSSYDKWPYGLSYDIPAYGNHTFDRNQTVTTYLNRTIHYNAGLLDNGPGDTSCAAQTEGSSHLSRAQNLDKYLSSLPQASHAAWTWDYMQNTSHQDERMMAAIPSLQRLFSNGLNDTVPGGSSSSNSPSTSGSNSGSKPTKTSSHSSHSGASQPLVPTSTIGHATVLLVSLVMSAAFL